MCGPHRWARSGKILDGQPLVLGDARLDIHPGAEDRVVGRRDLDRVEHPGVVAKLAEDRDAFVAELADAAVDPAPQAHDAGGKQGTGAIRGVLRHPRQGRVEPAVPLGEVPAHQPETPEGNGQAEGDLRVVGQGRRHSGAEIVAL